MKLLSLLSAILLIPVISAHAADPIYDIPLKDIDGKDATLKPYAGKVILIVNVASKCGFTPQYAGLEAQYEKYKDQGLVVLGFPCNQFGSQEPGTAPEIKTFCSGKYHVTFPLFEKIDVNGANRSPLYELLAGTGSSYPGPIKWNFTKFLISRDGKVLQRYASNISKRPAHCLLTGEVIGYGFYS